MHNGSSDIFDKECFEITIEFFVQKIFNELRDANYKHQLLLRSEALQASRILTPAQKEILKQKFFVNSNKFAQECAQDYIEQIYTKLAEHPSFKLSKDEVYEQIFMLFQAHERKIQQTVLDNLNTPSESIVPNSMFSPTSNCFQNTTFENGFSPEKRNNM